MATSEKPKPSQAVPLDLYPILRDSRILSEKQLGDIKAKILRGDYPNDSVALAERLIREKILTEYQARRFLGGKAHGLIVGKFVILDRIGAGSMGRVYKAHHVMMDRQVALKIIAPEIVSNKKVVSRFQREMRLVGRLDHPNVIRAFDADQIDKVLYIVMEYAKGESLGQILRRGPIPPLEMAGYAAQAALGLAHAHSQGMVHRDVKPSNLLLTDDKVVKVLDLGLGVLMEADSSTSFATADGIAVGTVDYMSPEQACGKDVDGRSDLYSLGCAMYHIMTGKLAFPGDSPIERMGRRISQLPVPVTDVKPDMPPALVKVLEKLMAQKPENRFQNGDEAAEALQAVVKPRPRPAPKVDKKGASGVQPSPGPVSPAEPVVVTVQPKYPAWFRGFAGLAERRPTVALAAIFAMLAFATAVGFVLGRVLR